MKHTKEEILNALNVIKDTCSEFKCDLCPFRDFDKSCIIQDEPPTDWDIKDEEDNVWRAFK